MIDIGIYEWVDSWITGDQDDGDDISCVSDIVLGAEVNHCVDYEIRGPNIRRR